MADFGWGLPPGCTDDMIDEAWGPEEDDDGEQEREHTEVPQESAGEAAKVSQPERAKRPEGAVLLLRFDGRCELYGGRFQSALRQLQFNK